MRIGSQFPSATENLKLSLRSSSDHWKGSLIASASLFVNYEIATAAKMVAFGYIWLHLIPEPFLWLFPGGIGQYQTEPTNLPPAAGSYGLEVAGSSAS